VADTIAVLDNGVMRACCPLDTFRRRLRQVVLHFSKPAPPLPGLPGLLESIRTENELSLTFANNDRAIEEQLQALGPDRLEYVALNFEDAFISYVGDRGEKSFIMEPTEVPG
jgi:ABC-2 type transport system ATP-binding protein